MRLERIQIELLKAALKDPERMSICDCEDEGYILVTANNRVVYRLDVNTLRVDLRGLNFSTVLQLLDEASYFQLTTSNELVPTDNYRNGGDARKYLYGGDSNRPYYVSQKLLENFPTRRLFMERYDRKKPAAIVDTSIPGLEIVGWVMPVNVKEDDTETADAADDWTE